MKNVKNRCLGNDNVFDKIQKIKELNLKQILLIILNQNHKDNGCFS